MGIRQRSKERWSVVEGFENYEVSTRGRVFNTARKRFLTGTSRDGYRLVKLSRKGCVTAVMMHRLVLRAFVGPIPEGMETRHLNGVRSDNRLVNLAYGTQEDNLNDRYLHNSDTLYSLDVKFAIKQVLMKREKLQCEIAEDFGVTENLVSRIFKDELRGRYGHPARYCIK